MYIWKSSCPSGSRGSVVSLVIKLWTGRPRIRIRQGQESFLVFKTPEPSLGPTLPPIQVVPATHSSGLKRPGCEAYHSPPSSDVVKDDWCFTPLLPCAFMAYVSVWILIFYWGGKLEVPVKKVHPKMCGFDRHETSRQCKFDPWYCTHWRILWKFDMVMWGGWNRCSAESVGGGKLC